MAFLPSNHFLTLPRPDIDHGLSTDIPDTSTLAAHDYDVDTRTGFMPPEPPLARLPPQWEQWEALLDNAFFPARLRHVDSPELSDEDRTNSERWRACVRAVSLYSRIAILFRLTSYAILASYHPDYRA